MNETIFNNSLENVAVQVSLNQLHTSKKNSELLEDGR